MPLQNGKQDHFFLPDLGSGRAVFMLVLISELFVVVQQLALPDYIPVSWSRFALSSLYVQWIVLTSSAFIYLIRPVLKNQPVVQVVLITLAGVTVIVSFVGLCAQQLDQPFSFDGMQILQHVTVALIIGAMILRYFYIQHEVQLQQQVIHNARLESLLGNMRPHFLFNSMNIITSLIRIDPEKAEQAVEDLSGLFRNSLQSNQTLIPIQQEIELSKRYLRIEQNRLGERLQIKWVIKDLPDTLTIPPFTLQPLVENAVYHGIQPLEEGGCVTITIFELRGEVQISVENPMPIEETISHGNQVALKNIRTRLAMLYDEKGRLTTQNRGSGHRKTFVAKVFYPCTAERKQS